jgi:hypothetical protein
MYRAWAAARAARECREAEALGVALGWAVARDQAAAVAGHGLLRVAAATVRTSALGHRATAAVPPAVEPSWAEVPASAVAPWSVSMEEPSSMTTPR